VRVAKKLSLGLAWFSWCLTLGHVRNHDFALAKIAATFPTVVELIAWLHRSYREIEWDDPFTAIRHLILTPDPLLGRVRTKGKIWR